MLKGNMLIAHGGGPTPVINSSLLGAVREAKRHQEIETIYGARFGAEGILAGDLIDLGAVEEERLVKAYRSLRTTGRQTLRAVAEALTSYQSEVEKNLPEEEVRQIPLYRNPAAAGYASPVYGEDFDYIDVTGETPRGAEFAVRIRGDSMEPYIHDGSIAYVNRDPLVSGDVCIFCVDGEMLCKQYVQDGLGMVYLFSLNRARADADVFLPRDSGRSMVCFGRVLLASRPRVPRR